MSGARATVAATASVRRRWPPAAVRNVLTAVETGRAAAFHHRADADDFLAAHLLVRELAATAAGLDATDLRLVARCPTCGSDRHGPPRVVGHPTLAVSLSHAPGVVAAAVGVADASGRLGVDVEPVARGRDTDALAGLVLAPAERAIVAAAADPDRAFLGFWVAKEALVKTGAADLDTLATVDLVEVTGPAADPTDLVGTWSGRLVRTRMVSLPGVGDVVAAVASAGEVTWTPERSASLGQPVRDRPA